jgi:hypothetical protein
MSVCQIFFELREILLYNIDKDGEAAAEEEVEALKKYEVACPLKV